MTLSCSTLYNLHDLRSEKEKKLKLHFHLRDSIPFCVEWGMLGLGLWLFYFGLGWYVGATCHILLTIWMELRN